MRAGSTDSSKAALSQLRQALDGPEGAVVLVRGPRGAGKSRLVREALAEALPAETRVHYMRGGPLSKAPHHAWKPVLEALIGELDDPEGTQVLEALVFEGHRSAKTPRERLALFNEARGVLEGAAERVRRVLVFEDFQWADEASRALVASLLPMAADCPLSFVLVTRGGTDEDDPQAHVIDLPAETGADAAGLDGLAGEALARLRATSGFAQGADPREVDALLGLPHDAQAWQALVDAGHLEGPLPGEAPLDVVLRVSSGGLAESLVLESPLRGQLLYQSQDKGAEHLLAAGRNDDATKAYEELLQTARAEGDRYAEAVALTDLAHVAYRSGDGIGILEDAERALAVARAVGDCRLLARSLRYVGIAHEFAGRYAEAEDAYLRLVELEEQLGASEQTLLVGILNSLGEIARARGQYELATQRYQRSWEVQRLLGPSRANDVLYLNNMGAALVGSGEHRRGRALLSKCIARQRQSGDLAFLSETFYYRGLSHLETGDPAAAGSDAVEAYLLAEAHGETEMLGLAYRLLGMVQARREGRLMPRRLETSDPESLLRESVGIFEEVGKRAEAAHSRRELASILAEQGRTEAAARALEAAQSEYQALGLQLFAEKASAQRRQLTTSKSRR